MRLLSSEHKPPRSTAKKTARRYRLAASNPLEPRRGLQRNRAAPRGAPLDAIGIFGVGLCKLLNVNRDAVLNGLPRGLLD